MTENDSETRGGSNKSSSCEKIEDQMRGLTIENEEGSTRKRSRDANSQEDTPDAKISRSASEISDPGAIEEVDEVFPSNERMKDFPKRPQSGQIGEHTLILVNCFEVHSTTHEISMYKLSFEPELPPDAAVLKESLVGRNHQEMMETFGVYIVENSRLWSLKKVTEEVKIKYDEMLIKINYIRSINMNDAPYEEFEQIMHIIFQRATKRTCLMRIGRNYYDKNTLKDKNYLLASDNVRLFPGYMMNMSATPTGMMLTVDISHRVISTLSVANLLDTFDQNLVHGRTPHEPTRMSECSSRRGYSRTIAGRGSSRDSYGTGTPPDKRVRINSKELCKRAEEEIIGRCVITTYRMRNWRIDEIDWTQNIDSTFVWRKKSGEEVEISYRDYYMENYRLRLTNTRYGMLVNLPKVKNSTGRKANAPTRFVLPPETCYLTGLSKKMKADFSLMKRIRDVVSLKPQQRFKKITDVVEIMSRSIDSLTSSSESTDGANRKIIDPNDTHMQIHIESDPMDMIARLMKDVSVRIKTGQGPMTVKAKDLMRHWTRCGCINQNPHMVSRWVVFHETRYDQQARSLINELMRCASQFRMLKSPLDVIEVNVNPRGKSVFNKWQEEIEMILEQVQGLQLIVVLIPNHFRADDVYSAVKTATLMNGKRLCVTQCIKAQRFDRRNQRSLRSVISSTLKQVLTKRGNVPWIVNYEAVGKFNPFDRSTMVCGIDVNHDAKRNRSTAGFCVSSDSRFSRYDTYVSIDNVGRENILGAEKCMVKALMNFHQENGTLPSHVIVFRDGVSNSELMGLHKTEVKAFRSSFKHREVLKRAKGAYAPKLTFVVVQKRVSLRIFNEQLQSGIPGTVLDTSVISSRFWDFYMLTTKPPPGKTARPTRYIVVYDDFNITNDEIQIFINQLCHTYYNFPGPIRVPAPVQIAHQVAYLYGTVIAKTNKTQFFTPKCKSKAYYL